MFSFRYEDTSYNIHRSASELVVAAIGTRPDRLTGPYKDVSPFPISCFGYREETVYGSLPDCKDASLPCGKRKHNNEDPVDTEGTSYTILKNQVPAPSKALLNRMNTTKTSLAVLQAGFDFLYSLLSVLP